MSDNGSRGGQDNAAIAFERVDKGFNGRKVLDKVSFSVARGEALCILGRSGTGKSVTLKLMIGLLKADGGRVLVEGEDMATLDEDRLAKIRRKMGFLFQSAALFDSFSLNQNLALPLHRLDRTKSRDEIKHAVAETLRQVGLEKDGEKMPVELSGGMQKRAGLARALVLKPEILLVDEPSSGLDRITAGEIDDLLMKVKTEWHTTMVIVTHDIHGARKIGDKFAVLDEGRLLAFGTPEELDDKQDNRLRQFISER
ncbi:MAG TPA: ATP-binding cassette domain-containing protein [Acidobacteriaceae bacterium]|jgi:phospholipid/cholesterol/gamma-HCH transport system ATP-binding protein